MSAPKFDGIKLVVFDLDGTLVDAFEDIARASNYIRELNGLPPLSVAEVKEHVGHGARVLISGILGIDDEEEIDRNYEKLVEFYSANPVGTTRLYPGVFEVLQTLQQRGYRTAVASNKPDPATQHVLHLLGIRALLSDAMGETPGIARKPAADMLEQLMERAGVRPEQTLMVGDTDVDVAFAGAAGVRVVCVTYGQFDREYLQLLRPDAILDSIDELLQLLE